MNVELNNTELEAKINQSFCSIKEPTGFTRKDIKKQC